MDTERLGLSNVPLREGGLAGAVAWIVGLAGTAGLAFSFGAEQSIGGTILLYSLLHAWPLVIGGIGLVLVYWLVPIGILMGCGYWVGANTDGDHGWVAIGLAVAAGYYALSAVSHVLVLGPLALVSLPVLLSGLIMPLVFAGLGGTVAE